MRQTSPSLPSFCRDRAGSSSIQHIIAGPIPDKRALGSEGSGGVWGVGFRRGPLWRSTAQVERSPKCETETDGGANDKHEVCGWSRRLGEGGLEEETGPAHFLKALRFLERKFISHTRELTRGGLILPPKEEKNKISDRDLGYGTS